MIRVEKEGIKLQVQVQPRHSKNEWGRLIYNDNRQWIQLKVTSPPVDGAANKACIKFISKQFKTAKSNISIIQGEKSRYKVFFVREYDEDKLREFKQAYPA